MERGVWVDPQVVVDLVSTTEFMNPGHRSTRGSQSSPPPFGSRGWKSGYQTRRQVPLTTDPFGQPGFFVFDAGSEYTVQTGLELVILLAQWPHSWAHRHVLPSLALLSSILP